MRRRSLSVVAVVTVLSALLSLAFVQAAVAQFPSGTVPVEFTMGPEQCPVFQSTVSGSGEYTNIVNVRTAPLGITFYTVDSTASGTATDDAGGTFTFFYRNVGTAVIFPGLGEFVQCTDHVELQGTGSAAGLSLDFDAHITPWSFATFNDSGAPPQCDPI